MASQRSKPDSFTLEAKRFVWLIKHTVFATTKHRVPGVYYALDGVKIEFTEGVTDRVTFVATDGRRVAIASAVCRRDKRATWPDKVIVPASALRPMLKQCKTAGDVTISVDVKQETLRVSSAQDFEYTELLEGNFPHYHDVILPASQIKHTAVIDVKDFKAALLRVAKACTEESRGASLTFRNVGGHGPCREYGRLTITTVARDSNLVGAEEVPITWGGERLAIRFNPVYLLDAIRVIGKGEITMSMVSPNGPCQIRPVSAPESYTYILMNISTPKEENHG